MMFITKILVPVAIIVITVEFITVFRVKRERRIWDNLNNRKEQ